MNIKNQLKVREFTEKLKQLPKEELSNLYDRLKETAPFYVLNLISSEYAARK